MPRPPARHPTDGELAILKVLWANGPSTVRQVYEALREGGHRAGYTSVLKLMQIMARKGLVGRDERQRSHVYRARLSEAGARRGLVGELIDRLFAGSSAELALHALAAKPATAAELADIRRFLDRAEAEGRKQR